MNKLKIAYIQSAPLLNQVKANILQLAKLFEQVKAADLVVLPELANSGYNFGSRQEALLSAEEAGKGVFHDFLSEKAATNNQIVISGLNEKEGSDLYNSAVIYDHQGSLHGTYRKLHLFNNEKQIFKPGNSGLPLFCVEGIKIGLQICFDWAFPEGWRLLALKGAQIIAHPSNLVLPYAQTAVGGYALTGKTFVITANRVGTDKDLSFTGCSVIAGPDGDILAKAGKESTETGLANVSLSDINKNVTPKNHIFDDRRTDVYELFQKNTK